VTGGAADKEKGDVTVGKKACKYIPIKPLVTMTDVTESYFTIYCNVIVDFHISPVFLSWNFEISLQERVLGPRRQI
jgi:hypothetical protein